MKHLLKLMDLSKEQIIEILNIADQLKFEQKNGIEHKILSGKTLGMIFSKASTRTRVSFEVGMYQLGGNAIFLTDSDTQIGRGESIEDTARVLSRFVDGIMIRTFKQSDVENLAKSGTIPIINGLTDYSHPCQVLADLMTIREIKKSFKDLKLCYIGDGNNMANSLIVGCIKVGMKIAICCPKEYQPDKCLIEWGFRQEKLEVIDDIKRAVNSSDVLYTDVWASMGQENQREQRLKAFANFQINKELLSLANNDAIVLHCLPAHKGEEITADVFEKYAPIIFEQSENRLHAQKAVLVKVMGKK
ncbi:MAG: ornithine carbamoyltransferase [Clostridiales bacterium]|nr:ornithine carbamoyltransferase [Clostridiales bacterium]